MKAKVLTWTFRCVNRHLCVAVCRPGHGASSLLPPAVQEGLEGGSLPAQEATRGPAGVQQARKKTAGVSSAGDGNFSAERLRFRLVIQVNVSWSPQVPAQPDHAVPAGRRVGGGGSCAGGAVGLLRRGPRHYFSRSESAPIVQHQPPPPPASPLPFPPTELLPAV